MQKTHGVPRHAAYHTSLARTPRYIFWRACTPFPQQVKTQRALNDYRKSAYPHCKDELTRLRYIGAITAARLKDARAWLGKDVPLECVDSVQSLKQLLEYVDTNRCVLANF
jgi:hypothetical protein